MPQMMPMYWLMMSITSMTMLMIIMSFIYFLMIKPILSQSPNKLHPPKMLKWSWKW